MKLQVVGCSHHASSIALRERLAFSPAQTREALTGLCRSFPATEAVLLSTCNRVELYTAAQDPGQGPSHEALVQFLAGFHNLQVPDIFSELFERSGDDAVRHLFTVAASLDSMVVGEAQILSQVKQAYELATEQESIGPLMHSVFQTAVKVARRVSSETAIHQRRVSIPSVAVADFASQIFETFVDKTVLVIGAGEMAEETLVYLKDEGARDITVVNRNLERGEIVAERFGGRAERWDRLFAELARADLVISTTGADQPIVTAEDYRRRIHPHRQQRAIFILDLAIPRDFEPKIDSDPDLLGVYLYSIDDLARACEENRKARDKELPAALAIVEAETERFMVDLYHRATGPIIRQLRDSMHLVKAEEQRRLMNKLSDLDDKSRQEIARSFDRLVNKLLHPPLESLREESRDGPPHGLLDALKRLFRMEE